MTRVLRELAYLAGVFALLAVVVWMAIGHTR